MLYVEILGFKPGGTKDNQASKVMLRKASCSVRKDNHNKENFIP